MPLLLRRDEAAAVLPSAPQRIISLVPSITELLYDLDLQEEVAGITKFCIHPESWFRSKARVGGTKSINMEAVRALNPDLIIANKEENAREQIESLAGEFAVWLTDIQQLDDACRMILDIGTICSRRQKAEEITISIRSGFSALQPLVPTMRSIYLIWQKPYMTIGADTFINDMMQLCGLTNLYSDFNRYPETNLSSIAERNCQLLLLSSEPFPFKDTHADIIRQALPGTRVILVDGEFFSWYGSRLRLAPAYFAELIEKVRNPSSKIA